MLLVFHLSCEEAGQRWLQVDHGREWRPACFFACFTSLLVLTAYYFR